MNLASNCSSKAVFLNRRAARGSPGICHFSFLRIFHEQIFYSGNILRRILFVNESKSTDPDVGLTKLQYTTRFN